MATDSLYYDTTRTDRKRDKLINQRMGKPYSFWERIKKGGIGCSRMVIDQMSEGFNQIKNLGSGIRFCNVELRPNGILVHFNCNHKSYCWPIAYHHINIYSSQYLSIHAQGQFIKFRRVDAFGGNASCFKKLQDLIVEHRPASPLEGNIELS